jgi:hypothetical protein
VLLQKKAYSLEPRNRLIRAGKPWPICAVRVATRTNVSETLEELHELLRAASGASSPPRHWAVKYAHCRASLLASEAGTRLPGFLVQCGSIERFRDFITLYHGNPEARARFVDAAFDHTRSRLN